MARPIPRLFPHAPDCCGREMPCRQTRSNDNGNRGRWYYYCTGCDNFIFDDWRGIDEGNPLCDCEEISRGQIEGGVVYVFRCARGKCDFRCEEDSEEDSEED
ncbi:hypothetical protein BJX66DRAFT_317020 [Aspergillus keveii]|uniref:GRF-like zinc ribbon domain-containing protein n=1 Tax=Aspergillus keveii TaxID=714993 RepID=A0ABR4FLV6_9EURO